MKWKSFFSTIGQHVLLTTINQLLVQQLPAVNMNQTSTAKSDESTHVGSSTEQLRFETDGSHNQLPPH